MDTPQLVFVDLSPGLIAIRLALGKVLLLVADDGDAVRVVQVTNRKRRPPRTIKRLAGRNWRFISLAPCGGGCAKIS